MSGGCSPLVPGVFSFQPFEMMAPSWLYFLTVAWGQGGTDHISVAESAAVLNTFLLPCSCCCLPVPIPVPVAIPISSVPCFSFTQLRATDLTYTEPVLCAPCTQQGSVAPGLSGVLSLLLCCCARPRWRQLKGFPGWTGLVWDLLHGELAVLWSKAPLTAETEVSANGRALMAGQGKYQEKAP